MTSPTSISRCSPQEKAKGGRWDEHRARVADPSEARGGMAGAGRSCSGSVRRRRRARRGSHGARGWVRFSKPQAPKTRDESGTNITRPTDQPKGSDTQMIRPYPNSDI
jgi:hypothetical protein